VIPAAKKHFVQSANPKSNRWRLFIGNVSAKSTLEQNNEHCFGLRPNRILREKS
jgi:hypothetical protein